jgi:hypothetical protein
MRTLIEQRITELTEERANILKRLAEQLNDVKDPSHSEGVISRVAKKCNEIDIRISESERMLSLSKNFYGSKTPNTKQDGSKQQKG